MDTLKRLEEWIWKHKSHSARIDIDNGYGATCWEVELHSHVKPKDNWYKDPEQKYIGSIVYASEVFFMVNDKPLPPNIVACLNDDDDFEWPGLSAVINLAIDTAEKLEF